jgi:formate dehydrogenase major subunit
MWPITPMQVSGEGFSLSKTAVFRATKNRNETITTSPAGDFRWTQGFPKMDRKLKTQTLRFPAAQKALQPLQPGRCVQNHRHVRKRTCWRSIKPTRHRCTGKAGTIMYAMGWTQHTTGTQNIRTMAIIQLLLGQYGRGRRRRQRPAGRIQCTGFHRPLPAVAHLARLSQNTPGTNTQLPATMKNGPPKAMTRSRANWWQQLSQIFGEPAQVLFRGKRDGSNEFGYHWLPKVDDGVGYSWLDLFDEMYKGYQRVFRLGQNPACSGSNAGKARKAMKNWTGWSTSICSTTRPAPSGKAPERIQKASKPKCSCCRPAFPWKRGQHHQQRPLDAVALPGTQALGNSKPDGDIIMELGHKLKEGLRQQGGAFPEPIINLKWDYLTNGEYDPHKVAKEINGYFLKDVTIKGKTLKKAPWCRVLPSCRPTVRPHRATGFTATATLKKATWRPAAVRRMHPTISVFILNLPGAGR